MQQLKNSSEQADYRFLRDAPAKLHLSALGLVQGVCDLLTKYCAREYHAWRTKPKDLPKFFEPFNPPAEQDIKCNWTRDTIGCEWPLRASHVWRYNAMDPLEVAVEVYASLEDAIRLDELLSGPNVRTGQYWCEHRKQFIPKTRHRTLQQDARGALTIQVSARITAGNTDDWVRFGDEFWTLDEFGSPKKLEFRELEKAPVFSRRQLWPQQMNALSLEEELSEGIVRVALQGAAHNFQKHFGRPANLDPPSCV